MLHPVPDPRPQWQVPSAHRLWGWLLPYCVLELKRPPQGVLLGRLSEGSHFCPPPSFIYHHLKNPLSIMGCSVAAIFPVDRERHEGSPWPAPSQMSGHPGRGEALPPSLACTRRSHKANWPLNTTISPSQPPFVSRCHTSTSVSRSDRNSSSFLLVKKD